MRLAGGGSVHLSGGEVLVMNRPVRNRWKLNVGDVVRVPRAFFGDDGTVAPGPGPAAGGRMATVVERVGRLDGTAAYIFKFNGLPGNLYQYDLWSSHHDMVCVQAAATDCETAPQQHKAVPRHCLR